MLSFTSEQGSVWELLMLSERINMILLVAFHSEEILVEFYMPCAQSVDCLLCLIPKENGWPISGNEITKKRRSKHLSDNVIARPHL